MEVRQVNGNRLKRWHCWMGRLVQPKQPNCRTTESGQAMIEMLMLIMGFIIIIAGIIYFGRVLYADIAVQVASYDCARAAVETLDVNRGPNQARQAAYTTLAGWQVNSDHAWTMVSYEPWDRGSRVSCRVNYRVPVGNIPGASLIFGSNPPMVAGATTIRVEQYKSRW